jgi:glycosyltransferase involved in cell wall biosynthesis
MIVRAKCWSETMTVWLPYTAAKTGSSVFMWRLGEALNSRGVHANVQEFPHRYQYMPLMLRHCLPPEGATAVITNSWSGFAFHRPDLLSICIDHLFVLDPAFNPYKSFAQRVFHEGLLSHFLSLSYRSANQVIAVSDYTASALRKRFPRVSVEVIRNGIDTDFFSPLPNGDDSRAGRPFRIGFAGTHSRRKGTDLLVPIMQNLGEGFELWHTGEALPAVPESVRKRIYAKGQLGPEQMREFYRQCDVLLAPTRLEGLPLVVLEAQACGLPVITTDCTSLPEAVADDVTGIVCPVDNITAMVAAVRALAVDHRRRAAMARSARERSAQEFGFEQMVDAYCDLLEGRGVRG